MRLSQFKQSKRAELVIDINSLEEYRSPCNRSIRLCRDKRSFLDDNGFWNVYPIAFNLAQVLEISDVLMSLIGLVYAVLMAYTLLYVRIAVRYIYMGGDKNRNSSMKVTGLLNVLQVVITVT